MMRILKAEIKIIPYLYYLLFFSVPLVFYHKTSEIFEFNKMITTYIFTVLILSFWIIKMVIDKKIIFRRTMLDLPIIFFLLSQTLSTLISIDQRTSFLGYYSRFNGGLLSSISYAILYWGLVSNLNFRQTIKLIKITFASLLISSVWAIFEHYGRSFSCFLFPEYRAFDVSCWVQDVAWRVFSTFGQPNWLAAWLVALIPLTWSFAIASKIEGKIASSKKSLQLYLWIILSIVIFTTLLFTKSKSGILAFAISFTIFWTANIALIPKIKVKILDNLHVFLITTISFLVIAFYFGTPWTPKLSDFISNQQQSSEDQAPPARQGPALEVGGTDSAVIRKIVWRGAINIWKNYPILGTGVETFAFSYYNFRPPEHNLTSEWDYLYNKAHNEYLNLSATTGTVGLISYLTLIFLSFLVIVKNIHVEIISKSHKTPTTESTKLTIFSINYVSLGLLSGYTSILVTNFFGFSVVPVALLFFLYPAMAINSAAPKDSTDEPKNIKISTLQTAAISIILILTIYSLNVAYRYWRADLLYADGKNQSDAGNYGRSLDSLNAAIKISPKESVYREELATTTADIAVGLYQQENKELANVYMEKSIDEIKTAISLSPANVNLKRTAANIFINLSIIEPNLIFGTRDALIEAVKQAPTDAKLFYNLGYAYIRTGETEKAIEILRKTIELKPDYRNAYYALGLAYVDLGKKDHAKEQFEYILKNINPEDSDAKSGLENL